VREALVEVVSKAVGVGQEGDEPSGGSSDGWTSDPGQVGLQTEARQEESAVGRQRLPTAAETFLAAVLKKGWSMRQLDVNTAFLNAPLDTPVYMECPEGYEKPGHVIRLRKALYGLREAPRAWNQLLVQSLRAMGFEPLVADPSIGSWRKSVNDLPSRTLAKSTPSSEWSEPTQP